MDYSISCNINTQQIVLHTENCKEISLRIQNSKKQLPLVSKTKAQAVFDASGLEVWTPENPVLYNLSVKINESEEAIKFGFRSLSTGGTRIKLNDKPYYFRGYIRGIVAHDHPNMTGGEREDYFRKNIMQAKKYGFNLVRFHSTVPDEKYVELADELGLLVHLEIGFSYKYNDKGEKAEKFLDRDLWISTLKKFRNHPSVMAVCIGNEMHNSGKDKTVAEFYEIGKETAPGILILDNTGWGEYDRECTDFYAQHIAYYFPFKKHRNMFNEDFYWKKNGSVHDLELESESSSAKTGRYLNPSRPFIAHETVHYIDIPDYEKMHAEFKQFAESVGEKYLEENGIEEPRYLTALPELIKLKGLGEKLPHYIKASQHYKKACIKVYFESLRAADNICGFEMLQLSDCLKYENKNGLIDFFDNDKYIPAEWFRNFNDDDVLLADLPEEAFYNDETVSIPISISHFSPAVIEDAELKISVRQKNNEEEIYFGSGYAVVRNGVFQIAAVELDLSKFNDPCITLSAKLTDNKDLNLTNEWKIWRYKKPDIKQAPQLRLKNSALEKFLKENASGQTDNNVIFTDCLNDETFNDLDTGKTVILNYNGRSAAETEGEYFWPSTFDRFKPCIWDRGHNLGGFIKSEKLSDRLGSRYFDLNLYYAIEEGSKINLDNFPIKTREIISGIDKPVRDRMKGLIHNIKDFLPEQTLRNFSYLFSLKAGKGNLIVCTFNLTKPEKPICSTVIDFLINNTNELLPAEENSIDIESFKNYLKETTEKGEEKEDVMNLYWAQDNRPVEDQLFWETAGVDLSKLH
ncbi:MAG: glycoside hydrolase family 2 TIM barrel-domain containing protein [Planctomycetota bacterium]|jgi:hypothetical protein